MIPFPSRRLPLFLAALAATAVQAAPGVPDTTLDPVVVTATRTAEARSSLSSDVSVIEGDTLRASGAQTVGEALGRLPGVQFNRPGGPGQPASLYLRGANGNHTLVLIDGQRLSPGADGSASFDTIPLAAIERIEIVRGSASGLYGADAVGGVVQIFTRAGAGKPAGTASIDYGSHRTVGASAGYGGAVGDTRFSVTVDARNSDGYDITRPESPYAEDDDDAWRQRSATLSLSQRLDERHELGVRGFYVETDADYDGGAYDPDPHSRRKQSSVSAYSNNRFGDAWQSDLLIGQGRNRYETDGAYPSRSLIVQDEAQWTNTLESSTGQWLLGLEYLRERLESDTDYDRTRRNNRAALAGWQRDFGAHHLQANLRYDDNSQFGGATTGGLGYAWFFAQGWQLFANGGTSFHAPSFVDLYFPSWPGYPPAANPDLVPEKGRSFDGGLRWQGGASMVDATLFYNRIRNLIVLDQNYTPQNLNEARIRGLTLNGSTRLGSLELNANATWQDPQDQETGKPLPRRARVYGAAGVAQTLGDWRWQANLGAAGQRYDKRDGIDPMGGYAVVDLGLDYRIARDWQAQLRVNNAFDRDYQQGLGYASDGRTAFIKLVYDGR
ncbi:outer membrane protein [Chitiniphilus shinanonensis]|uniref:Outer membrane protein n=1 Tax=Chitiniphilus shinanonensis TaxID=553088 RepID=A0ABQ6BVE1_9NEIS|nr:TonB-dependent receptor [Chitiniphilus shinanonensis]GLS05721.1 outer membrane protein [Chitiniphilus shinanonensis]